MPRWSFDLVDRHLLEGMAHRLPAGIAGLPGDALVVEANASVDRQGRVDAEALVEVEETPDADAHAVLVPAPVRHVRQQHLASGAGITCRAIGREMSHTSRLTIDQTMMRAPPGSWSGGRSTMAE
jgi:hypothetical protein